MQLHSSRLFLYRHPNNMLSRCLQILFSEHCINIRKRLAAVEFLCDLAGDDLQTHHFLPQIRMMVVQMSQLGQLSIRAKPAAAAVGKLSSYALNDHIRLSVGYDWFGGNEGIFGRYKNNSEIWAKAKYNF